MQKNVAQAHILTERYNNRIGINVLKLNKETEDI